MRTYEKGRIGVVEIKTKILDETWPLQTIDQFLIRNPSADTVIYSTYYASKGFLDVKFMTEPGGTKLKMENDT